MKQTASFSSTMIDDDTVVDNHNDNRGNDLFRLSNNYDWLG